MAKITFDVNNGMTLMLEQFEPGERVYIVTKDSHGVYNGKTTAVSPATFVMMINHYRYIKENDIYNEFINPNGKNREV